MDANTIETPTEYDALPKLRPGEPYFALIGRDSLAPKLVQKWASENRKRALEDADAGRIDQARLHDELVQSTQAEEVSWAMAAYRKGHKPVEQAAKPRPTYSGHELPPECAERDRQHKVRRQACPVINNAVAELTEQVAALAGVIDEPDVQRLRNVIGQLRGLSDRIKVKRPGIDE